MGFPVRRGARRDAIASGERRNAAGAPIRPTEGRPVASLRVFADAGHRHAKRAYPRGKIIPVKGFNSGV